MQLADKPIHSVKIEEFCELQLLIVLYTNYSEQNQQFSVKKNTSFFCSVYSFLWVPKLIPDWLAPLLEPI